MAQRGQPTPSRLATDQTARLRSEREALSNAGIGQRRFLAEATVKTHVTHVLAKLGLRDRLQAVVYAYESRLVRPGGQNDVITTQSPDQPRA